MPTYYVIEPWTYDNLGSMDYNNPLLSVPYDLFVHTKGETEGVVESFSFGDSFQGGSDYSFVLTMQISEQTQTTVDVSSSESLFIDEVSFIPSASSEVSESLLIDEIPTCDLSGQFTQTLTFQLA